MEAKQFIEKVAGDIVKSCNMMNLLPSPSIAQAILESNKGNSELAMKANALFGIKANSNWNGAVYTKRTKEFINGAYVDVEAQFRAYGSWIESIADHTVFLATGKRYANLIGVRDYKKYCKLIKEDGYATSPTYTQSLISCIQSYGLTKYDEVGDSAEAVPEKKVLSFNVHAGHNPSGMIACGSACYLDESVENRKVCAGLIKKIRQVGHTAYDCTCNNGTSQKDVLQKIVEKCNAHTVDFDISIHFNAVSKESVSDNKTKGVEVWIHPSNVGTEIENVASSICKSVANLGFKNRGVKYSSKLYVLKNTKAPAMLIECCFVDDVDDAALYNCDKMTQAIFEGLSLSNVNTSIGEAETIDKTEEKMYYIITGIYRSESNAKAFAKILANKGYLMDDNGNLIKGIATQIKEM